MNGEWLKLTAYLGERRRTGRKLVADELLDLYGRHGVAVSVLLRGSEGFGERHRLRTDRLLTLSEDLPVVAVAVDTRSRILALLDDVLEIRNHGLVTLERARLLEGQGDGLPPGAELFEETKLTLYLGRHDRVSGTPGFVAVCDLLHRRGVAGATVLLGVDGTLDGHRRRARFLARNASVPLMIIAVGDGDRVAALLPELRGLAPGRPLTLERVRVCKRDGAQLSPPPSVPPRREDGLPVWQKLTVYTSAAARHGGSPAHVALVRSLRERGTRGATSIRGIWGFHGQAAPHGDRLLALRRHVPVMTVSVDSPPAVAEAFGVVDELTRERGLVTAELVPAALGHPAEAG